MAYANATGIARKRILRGDYHHIALATSTLGVTFALLQEPGWLLLGMLCVGVAGFSFACLCEHRRAHARLTAARRAEGHAVQRDMLREETERLEALSLLAGGVAHDFNNLLTVLVGCAEVAESSLTRDPGSARKALRELQTATERATSLTAQLLEFASRRPARPEPVDLNEAVARAGRMLARQLEHATAPIVLQVVPARAPCFVYIDPGSLERLLLQLALNARDAMPSGGTLRIAVVRSHEHAGEAVLEVGDTGTGIRAHVLPHIFEPFFTTKARSQGVGLGLASVYGIVKQSRGRIEVCSDEGVGTTFRIHWPHTEGGSRRVQARSEGAYAAKRAGIVLLVDDDPAVRAVALGHLEGAGYSVLAASSGAQALALLDTRRSAVQLVVSDVCMPGMSGVELARAVRSEHAQLPILLMSGCCEDLHGELGDLTRFLPKPFSGRRLLAAVRHALDDAPRAERALREEGVL